MGIFSKKQNSVPGNNPASASDVRQRFANMILDIVSDGAAIIDAKGVILYCNATVATTLGFTSPEELRGMNFLDVLVMENSNGVRLTAEQNPLIQAFMNGEKWHSREYVVVNSQGDRIPEMITFQPVDEAKTEFVAIFHDISEALEEESEQAEFISTASHEMRTPVASIEGYIGLALNPATATIDDRARQFLNEAHSSAQHLGRLFKDLLDVTNLDDHRLKPRLIPSDLNELVRNIANAHIPACASKGLTFSFGANDGTQTINQSAYSMIDPDFLREVLDNLISNAVKYTPSGGAIWVGVQGDGDNVLINVTDSGMGISPDNLTHIFQKFYRVDNSQTRTIGGTGLGLYIVKQRVEAMGGRVWAESAFGQGSTFFVSVPRLTTEEFERQYMVYRNTQAMTPQTPPSNLGKTAVLAADGFKLVSNEATVPMVEALNNTMPSVYTDNDVKPLTDKVEDLPNERLDELKKKFAEQMASSDRQNGV